MKNNARPDVRLGFTTVELLIVLGIASFQVATTVPSILPALRRNSVNSAAAMILSVAEQDRRLARSSADSSRCYEVTVDGSGFGKAFVTITFDGNELLDAETGQPVMRKNLNANAVPYTTWDAAGQPAFRPTSSPVSWCYAAQTGRVVKPDGRTQSEVGSGMGSSDPYTGALNLVDTTQRDMVASAPRNVMANEANPARFGVCTPDGTFGVGIVIFNIGVGYSHEIIQQRR